MIIYMVFDCVYSRNQEDSVVTHFNGSDIYLENVSKITKSIHQLGR
jgi:hypothetical protein